MFKLFFPLLLSAFFGLSVKAAPAKQDKKQGHVANKLIVPVGGNTWTINGGVINNNGLTDWTSTTTRVQTYFYLSQSGALHLSLNMNPGGKNKLKITVQGISKEVIVKGSIEKEFYVGKWEDVQQGYVMIEMQGVSKSAASFGTVSSFGISGSSINTETTFVKDNNDNYFYWGRRGPSVHLKYTIPPSDISDFYSEITVPEGNDVIGSYFMANGFAEGYFGIQVNSATERRILFSVWSPYATDNPASIPQELKITLLKKSNHVHAGEFGNEGAGGQSYLVYPWKAGMTYKFLLRGQPQSDNSTIYTAYFFAPEENKWMLIASFKRPVTNTYLKNLHSFLENFITETGDQTRMAIYSKQWVRDTDGVWTALTSAKFTADQTARKRFRLDYAGGIKENAFFLKNCGFFFPATTINSQFNINKPSLPPEVDFAELP
ncbi:MAG: hypothetical protein RLZZ196_593 [Bacteroidota bacterium]|jgi:hypothetical protein